MPKKPPKKQDPAPKGGHRRSSATPPVSQGSDNLPDLSSVRLNMEQEMARLGKLLNEREFESIDEVNAFLQELLAETGGMIPKTKAETPLEKAQELVYQAMQASNPKKAAQLARKALKLSPDCADAYLLLGDLEAKSVEEARDYYEKAVAAGERAIGPETFETGKGHFWGIIETRPYMRARQQLADLLWELGEPEAALNHYREMMELNPGDNQGVRYVLLSALLQLCKNDEAEALLAQFEDDAFAIWHYNRALLLFRKYGRSPEAEQALLNAFEQNEYVPDYLLGLEEMPFEEDFPEAYGWGDEEEAILYVSRAMVLWAQTPGAQTWMAKIYNDLDLE
ncbi:MAG: tetratricopeptide repeat protein [Caldilineaceae bacterium]|nr:tetratricopeptide repeat protein [Caldilineaceae bacterium]